MKTKTLTLAIFLGSWMMQTPLLATLTDTQKEELFQKGTISTDKGHFEVHFMPGSENIRHDAIEKLKEAENLLQDLVRKDEFWRDTVLERFHTGLEYMKEGALNGIGSIPEDFRKTLTENRATDGSFGSTASKVKNWIGFLGNVAGDTLQTIFEVPFGAVYALVAPTGTILYRPIAAGTKAVVEGALWPIVKFTWNGAAWELSKNSREPKENDMTVTFVPNNFDHEHSYAGDL